MISNDLIYLQVGKAYTGGGRKRNEARIAKKKREKAARKNIEIEYVTLSSDSEEEDLDSEDDLEDPFSMTEEWAVDDEASSSGTDFNFDDDEIEILDTPKKKIASPRKSSAKKSPREAWVTSSKTSSSSSTSPRKRKESPGKKVSPSKKSPSKLAMFRHMMEARLRQEDNTTTDTSEDDEIMIL